MWESGVVCERGIVHVRGRVGCMREGWNSVGVRGCVCEWWGRVWGECTVVSSSVWECGIVCMYV